MESERQSERQKIWAAEIDAENEKSNLIGNTLLILGTIIFIISIIVTIFFDFYYYPAILLGLIVAGFGEVINLLQKIYVNTKK